MAALPDNSLHSPTSVFHLNIDVPVIFLPVPTSPLMTKHMINKHKASTREDKEKQNTRKNILKPHCYNVCFHHVVLHHELDDDACSETLYLIITSPLKDTEARIFINSIFFSDGTRSLLNDHQNHKGTFETDFPFHSSNHFCKSQ